MSEEDISLEEKRVYSDATRTTTAFVASAAGVARVDVSGDIVGEFALLHRGEATDLAIVDGRLAVATPTDVVISDGETFHETGFGSADAVGVHGDLVASGDGRVASYDGRWTTCGEVSDVRSVDGDLIGAASGVYRLDGDHVGLTAVRDVSSAAAPLAATDDGLYALANGWVCAVDGSFEVVAGRADGRALAATPTACYERPAGGAWSSVDLPVDGRIADAAFGDAAYVVTRDGTFLVNAGDGWRHRSLGLPDVSAVAIAE